MEDFNFSTRFVLAGEAEVALEDESVTVTQLGRREVSLFAVGGSDG